MKIIFRFKSRNVFFITGGMVMLFYVLFFMWIAFSQTQSSQAGIHEAEPEFRAYEVSQRKKRTRPFGDLQLHPVMLKPYNSRVGESDGDIRPDFKILDADAHEDHQAVKDSEFPSRPDRVITKLNNDWKQLVQENHIGAHKGYSESPKHKVTVGHNIQSGKAEEELIKKDPQGKRPIILPENDVKGKDYLEVDKNKTYGAATFPDFVEYGKPTDPGENGTEFIFGANDLTEEQKKKKEEDFKIHYFDEWTSKKIAVHRHLPDNRDTACQKKEYISLPAASILIVFYNEAWTTLLRSIHSILDRTPDHLLKEIVILDDFSDLDHLKEPLEIYLKPYKKIRLLRAKERLGLIRARNLVFEQARGDVVIFLDSHIECFPGWIEPLLKPIYYNNTTVTFPVIESINSLTFGLEMTSHRTIVGGLQLNSLSFKWLLKRKIRTSQDDKWSYAKESPTMPGGLYAISRKFFHHLGQYDPGMDYWGAENLEISFKIWMCGGSILMMSCSHVGHIFRKINPALRGVRFGLKNAFRVAEVWMDQYKHFFYEKILYRIPDFGNVSSRVELRKSLKCHDFTWYLNDVYPELKEVIDENSVYVGQIKNEATRMCLGWRKWNELSLFRCQENRNSQIWNLATDGIIFSLDRLIGVQTLNSSAEKSFPEVQVLTSKHGKSTADFTWVYDDTRRLVHKKTGLCLQASSVLRKILLRECSSSPRQRWHITTREELRARFQNKGVRIDWSV